MLITWTKIGQRVVAIPALPPTTLLGRHGAARAGLGCQVRRLRRPIRWHGAYVNLHGCLRHQKMILMCLNVTPIPCLFSGQPTAPKTSRPTGRPDISNVASYLPIVQKGQPILHIIPFIDISSARRTGQENKHNNFDNNELFPPTPRISTKC